MSIVSSVASSYASCGDSNAPLPDQPDAVRAADGSYSDDFLASEELVEKEVVQPATTAASPDSEQAQEDEDGYEDDAFEGPGEAGTATEEANVYEQDKDAFEYSDDWVHETLAAFTSAKDLDPSMCGENERQVAEREELEERAVQHPGHDLEKLTGAWAREKSILLAQRSMHKGRTKDRELLEPREVSRAIDVNAAAVLLRRVRQLRTTDNTSIIYTGRPSPRIPRSLIELAKVHKLLTLSSQRAPQSTRHSGSRESPRSISTFCSVKTANLHGKLATYRLSDLCARWHASPDNENAMSVATSEFVVSILEKQRRVLCPHDHTSVLGALHTHATGLDRAVAMSTHAMSDTQALLQDAHRILSAADAHICRCHGPPSLSAT